MQSRYFYWPIGDELENYAEVNEAQFKVLDCEDFCLLIRVRRLLPEVHEAVTLQACGDYSANDAPRLILDDANPERAAKALAAALKYIWE